jgi:signal transduction histidine kinase
MRRDRDVGLTGRLSIILVAVVILLCAGAAVFYLYSQSEARRDIAVVLADRIFSVVELVEESPADQRPNLLRALRSPWLRASISPRPPKIDSQVSPEFANLRTHLRRQLQTLGDRTVVLGESDEPFERFHRPEGHREHERERELPMPPPDHHSLVVGVQLADSNWLVFRVPVRPNRLPREAQMIGVIGVSALVVLFFAIWAAHRVTRPLARFAVAADRLGVDLRTMMLAAISHDLRTVLTRLKLRAEFIDDPQQRDKAVADIDEMRAMLDASLSFAREDTVEEKRTSVDLSSLLQSLCDDLADAGSQVSYDGPARLAYWSQPVAMRRAFANLIGNALKYGNEAQVSARDAQGGVVVEIGDRGPGIPAPMRERVFAPFFRLEASRNRETGGTGLGLSVARSIIRRHGGDITLHDRDGGGLLVRVTLPAVAGAATHAAAE